MTELEALPAPVQAWPEAGAETEAIGAAILCAIDALPLAARKQCISLKSIDPASDKDMMRLLAHLG